MICSTLARTPGQASTTTVAERAGTASPLSGLDNGLGAMLPATSTTSAAPANGRRPRVAGEDRPQGGGHSAESKLALAIVVVLGGLLAWALFQGIFHLMLHIFEYVVVAIVAGWAGYKAGHYRGRRAGEREGRSKRRR